MTPFATRLGLAAFVILSGALATNMFVLQPPGRGVAAVGPEARLDALRESLAARSETLSKEDASSVRTATAEAKPLPANERIDGNAPTSELTRAIQRELKAKGYETGAVDGVAGLVTRAAIMAYEADSGLPLTGEPRQALLQHIVLGSGGRAEANPLPGGSLAATAETIVHQVEEQLAKLGYATRPETGRLSPETIRAIRKFESDHRMPESGRISGELVAKLATLVGQGMTAEPR